MKEIESPSGLDLHPQPPSPVRLSKRAGILVLVVVFAVAALVGYGIVTRGNRSFQTGFHPDDAKGLTAATDAGKVIAAQIPNRAGIVGGSADRLPAQAELRPPGQALVAPTGDPSAQRMYTPTSYPPPPNTPQYREPTPEEKRLALAYEREMQAMDCPTTSQAATGTGFGPHCRSALPRALKGAAPSLLDCSGHYKDRRQQRPDLAWRGTESFPA